jgi:hypothetical protein
MDNNDRRDAAAAAPELLAHVDEARRSSLRKLLITGAYAIPAIASFSLAGLSSNEAHAYTSNLRG